MAGTDRAARARELNPRQNAGKPKKVSSHLYPRTPRDKKFCDRWLIHFDHVRAYKEAGFGGSKDKRNYSTHALAKLRRFEDYLRPLQQAKAQVVAKRLTVSSEDVLDQMTRAATFDPREFLEVSDEPIMKKVKDEKGQETEQISLFAGRPRYASRLRPLHELTAEQAAVVQVIGQVGDEVIYRLPTVRERHAALTSVGRQLGIFLDKVIWESHQYRHRSFSLQVEQMPTDKLTGAVRQLLPFVGPDFAAQLGFSQEEVAEAITQIETRDTPEKGES